MKFSHAFVLVGLVFAPLSTVAEELEAPTVKTLFQVEREKGGSCSIIRAGASAAHPALVMTDICHGWSTSACNDMVLVEGHGLVSAQGRVLFTDADRSVDLVPLVDRALGRRWSGQEHLHLVFESAHCDGATLVAPFSGSRLKIDSTGSATAMKGVIRITSPTDIVVRWARPASRSSTR